MTKHLRYVIVTAAYNEEGFIEELLRSVMRQTILPEKWVIVSDGSTDQTDMIVQRYMKVCPFITLFRIADDHPRNFSAQADAINTGFSLLRELEWDYIGNLDADVSFTPEYFEALIEKFERNPALGLAGGFIHEKYGAEFQARVSNKCESVPHAVQLFRRACFETIGGAYLPLPYGGPDWHAEVAVRMNGWEVQSFPDLKVFHHRPTGSAGGVLRYCFRQGLMDYSLGVHPAFEVGKLASRLSLRPMFLGALMRMTGFVYGYVRREKRLVSDDFVKVLREEQVKRLWSLNRLRF